MNKSVLYITYVDYLENAFPGVQAKIAGQIEAMSSVGFNVERINQYGKQAQYNNKADGSSMLFDGISRRFAILNAVKTAVQKTHYTAAYIRFQFFSEDVRRIMSLLKKHGTKVFMEFPTYPYEGELHQQGNKGELKLFCDRLYRKSCARNIDYFVTQAEEEEAILGVPCIQVLNGLDYASHSLRNVQEPKKDEIHLIAVASMLPWHGYDRVLEGLVEYYKHKQDIHIILHLVGEGKELSRYKQIVRNAKIENNVIFYGMKGGKELDTIVDQCDIAIGSLAAFRIGLKKMSTLKSREYCAWGFPTINATPTDILDMDDPCCLFVPEDESPVDMKDVVAFYQRVYFESELSAVQIATEIREKAANCSDVHTVFMPVIKAMK